MQFRRKLQSNYSCILHYGQHSEMGYGIDKIKLWGSCQCPIIICSYLYISQLQLFCVGPNFKCSFIVLAFTVDKLHSNNCPENTSPGDIFCQAQFRLASLLNSWTEISLKFDSYHPHPPIQLEIDHIWPVSSWGIVCLVIFWWQGVAFSVTG